MQMVVVSDPHLVSQILNNNNLAKPTHPVMVHFRQVRGSTLIYTPCPIIVACYILHETYKRVQQVDCHQIAQAMLLTVVAHEPERQS